MNTKPYDFVGTLSGSKTLSTDTIRDLLSAATGIGAGEFRRAVDQVQQESARQPELAVRAGIGFYLLGQSERAIDTLSGCHDGLGRFYLGQAYSNLGKHEEAAKEFDEAANLGYSGIECKLRKAGELRMLGQHDEAEQLVRSTGADGARLAEYSHQMGCILSDRGDRYGAVEYFERAVDMDPYHQRALFALAVQSSQFGNDDDAIQLYERCLSRPPFYEGALLNLGLLYEDKENYPAAQYCFERILQHDPLNERAKLSLKDIEATSSMYYDEEILKQQQRVEQVLNKPVTDFELSVRCRNCLVSLNIVTIGDLTRITEQELLSAKNFGETSLTEIRDLMQQHALSVGQNVHQKQREPSNEFRDMSPQEQALLSTPVAELQLSVRARKCMSRLGIATMGELVQRTPDELLGAKNFGVTSLNEIRAKLSEINLRLRND